MPSIFYQKVRGKNVRLRSRKQQTAHPIVWSQSEILSQYKKLGENFFHKYLKENMEMSRAKNFFFGGALLIQNQRAH